MQHLIVNTSTQIDNADGDWQTNGAGHLVNNKYGFGVLDSGALVDAATSPNWKAATEQHVCRDLDHTEDASIPPKGSYKSALYTSGCLGKTSCVTKLEHVRVFITLTHARRGALRIRLTSPQGTTSELLSPRSRDFNARDGFQNWPFMSVFHWGENPVGTWTLEVSDTGGFKGTFKRWSLRLYGTCDGAKNAGPVEKEHCAKVCTKNCNGLFAQTCSNCSLYCHCDTGNCLQLCKESDIVDQQKKECRGNPNSGGNDGEDEDEDTYNGDNYGPDKYPNNEATVTPHSPSNVHFTSLSMFMKLLVIFILVAVFLSTLLMLWLCKISEKFCWAKQKSDKPEVQKNVAYRPVANTPEVNNGNLHNLGNLYM